jgi:hypothetical protein
MGCSISEGGTQQHTLFSLPASCCTLNVTKVVISYGLKLKVIMGGKKAER